MPPVDALHQHRELRRRQEHFSITCRGPGEAASFQAFCQQAQAITGGPEKFDLAAAASPENEDVAGHRIIFQRGLHFGRQAIEAISHVGDTCHQPDLCAGR